MTRVAGRRDERGLVLVFAAMLIVALLVVAATVLDIGNGRQTRRRAQNAIDAAALAGAEVYDGGAVTAASARTRALALLGVNSFSDTTATGDVNVRNCGNGESCTIEFGFSPAPAATAPVPAASSRFCVSIAIVELEVETVFAGVIGTETLGVGVNANGCKRYRGDSGGGTLRAAHAFGDCSNNHEAFLTGGSSVRFEGDIHSNDGAEDSGGADVRTGAATLVQSPPFSPATGPLWVGASTGQATVANPFAADGPSPIQATDYGATGTRSATARSLGLWYDRGGDVVESDGTMAAGIHYSTGKFEVSGDAMVVAPVTVGATTYTGVTIVAREIIISGNNGHRLPVFNLEPNRIVMLASRAASNYCSDEGVVISASCAQFDGVVLVPDSRFRISGEGSGHDDNDTTASGCAGATAFSGGVIAPSIIISGNMSLLRGGVGGPGGLAPEVFLDA